MTSLSPGLLRFYRRTDYVVGVGPAIRIGRRGTHRGILLTAANPGSRRMPSGWNARMNRRLLEAARRLDPVPAHGQFGPWREDGFLLSTSPSRARVLGRRFRQNAMVVLGNDGRAALLLLR